jgi:hypothetical protein
VLVAPEPVDETPPIACSLGGGDMKARIDEWQTLLGDVRADGRVLLESVFGMAG